MEVGASLSYDYDQGGTRFPGLGRLLSQDEETCQMVGLSEPPLPISLGVSPEPRWHLHSLGVRPKSPPTHGLSGSDYTAWIRSKLPTEKILWDSELLLAWPREASYLFSVLPCFQPLSTVTYTRSLAFIKDSSNVGSYNYSLLHLVRFDDCSRRGHGRACRLLLPRGQYVGATNNVWDHIKNI